MTRLKLNQRTVSWAAARDCIGESGMLSVVMPAFNLGKIIADNLARVDSVFKGNIPFELIPVDDGSSDSTASELRRIAGKLPSVRPVLLPRNRGKGSALKAGVASARGNYILLLDGDLDLPAEPVFRFFEIMQEQGADIVIGSKMHPESHIDYPWQRRLASIVYYSIVKLLVGLPVHDTQTGMKLFKAGPLKSAFRKMLEKRFAFDVEVLSIAIGEGCKVAEAPIIMDFGEKMGALTARNVAETMRDTLAVFYRTRILRYYDSLIDLSEGCPAPRVSVLVACPEPTSYLSECVAGLLAQNYPDMEIIVLPDNPVDASALAGERYRADPDGRLALSAPCETESREEPAGGIGHGPDLDARFCATPEKTPRIRVIPTGKLRPAEKRNLGIKAATGEIIAFVDDDAAPQAGWIRRAIPYFAIPDVAGVGGPGVTPPSDPFLAQCGGRVLANRLVAGSYRRRYTPTRVCEEEDIPSCNLIVRKSVLEELGGFDTEHWPGEDTMLCSDIVHKLGKRLIYDPWVTVSHHRRPLLGPHNHQIGRYALHRGKFARAGEKTSRRLSYFLPTLLLLGIFLGPVTFAMHPHFIFAYCAAVSAYLLCVLLSTMSLRHPICWVVTALGVIDTHLVYGWKFLEGFLGAKTPTKASSFDHGGKEIKQ